MFNAIFNDGLPEKDQYGGISELPTWNIIEPYVRRFAQGANGTLVHPIVVNSSELSELRAYNQESGERRLDGDHLWILCGGNTISRGLTLPGLVCSYFDRFRQSSAIDTMAQMSRWLGYRPGYELLPRIWMDEATVAEMPKIAFIEKAMHEGIRESFDDGFSPADESHHQEIFCYGRRLSGHTAAQKINSRTIGTYGSTHEIKVDEHSATTVFRAVQDFICRLGPKTDSNAKGYAYPDLSLWQDANIDEIRRLIEDARDGLTPASFAMMQQFLDELKKCSKTHANVVFGEPQGPSNKTFAVCENVTIKSSAVKPIVINEGYARFHTLRLYLPYYAMIPKQILNKLDADLLAKDIEKGENGSIIPALRALCEKTGYPVPVSLAGIVGNTEIDKLPTAILKIAHQVQQDSENVLPPPVHQLIGYIADGYRNRSSSFYMAESHARAHQTNPTLQIQFITPSSAEIGKLSSPLCSLSFFWPEHNPDGFYRISVQ